MSYKRPNNSLAVAEQWKAPKSIGICNRGSTSLELLVIEFQPIFIFRAADLSIR
jgi:hypothetical protein